MRTFGGNLRFVDQRRILASAKVGDDVDLAAVDVALRDHVERAIDRTADRRGLVREFHALDGALDDTVVARALLEQGLGALREGDDIDHVAAARLIDDVHRDLLGRVEGGSALHGRTHAEARVDAHDDVLRHRAREEQTAAQRRARERDHQCQDGQCAQNQNQDAPQVDAAHALLVDFVQELERGEFDALHAAAIEQMNDDRDRGRNQPDQECNIEKSHELSHARALAEVRG